MSWIAEMGRRLLYLIRRRKIERELELEMRTHHEMMSEPVRFGNTLRLREEARDVWGWNWLDAIVRDLQYAVRSLRRAPGFTAAAVLILTAAIGVNLAFLQIVNSTLLRPLPVRDPSRLVRFDRIWTSGDTNSTSSVVPYPAIQFIRTNNNVLSAVLTQTDNEIVWGNDPTDRMRGSYVSANWFEELGVVAAYGRLFRQDSEEAPDSAPVVVLGEEFWTARFGRDTGVIGKTIRINDRPATVIGIAPRGFTGLKLMQQEIKAWMPMSQIDYFTPGSNFKTSWSGGPDMYGRLRPGLSLAAAKEGLRAPMDAIALQRPNEFNRGEWLEPYSGSVYFERPNEHELRWRVMMLVTGLFILVLLIACANLSSVILSRSMGRVRELSLRTALGAGRWRILTHLLAESAAISVAGTVFGAVLAYWLLTLFAAHVNSVAWLQWRTDWYLVFFSLVITTFATAALGLIPASKITRRRQMLNDAIKDGGQQASATLNRTRMRQMLIAVQIAGSCVLLVVGGMMVRRLQNFLTDPGFDFKNVTVLNPNLSRFGVSNGEAQTYWTAVKMAVESWPEVDSVSLVSAPPLGNTLSTSRFADAREVEVSIERIGPEFFRVMNIPIYAGRTFNASDTAQSSIIISKRLALAMYGRVDVVGEGFPKAKPEQTVIGVVSDARLFRLERLNDAEAYFPLSSERLSLVSLLVRTRSDPENLLPRVRQVAREYNMRIFPDAHVMAKDFSDKTNAHRTTTLIAAALAGIALILACLGVFGLLSYAITLRQKEIGIRLALGASRCSIVSLIASQLFWPALAGGVFGVSFGALATSLIEEESRFLGHADGGVLGAVVLVFLLSACLASLVPVIRATRIDVLHALRYE